MTTTPATGDKTPWDTLTLYSNHYSASRSLKVSLVVSQKMITMKKGGTHYRARPLTIGTQGHTTVLVNSSPPPVRLSQRQEHVHGATGVGVHLTEGRCGLGQEVMELPYTHAHKQTKEYKHTTHTAQINDLTAKSTWAGFHDLHPSLILNKRASSMEILNSFLAQFNLPGKSAPSI